MEIYLFNADSDLAQAHHGAYYMPPATVKQFMADLSMLPCWYAPSGSAIFVSSDVPSAFLHQLDKWFGCTFQTVGVEALPALNRPTFHPWGWNTALRHQLVQAGIEEGSLPTPCQLDTWRNLSSRHTIAPLLDAFVDEPACVGEAWCLTDLEACRRLVDELPACVLKLPWSGSGKGINWCRHGFTPQIQSWCAKALRTQGSIQGAPLYDKVLDFAMEFHLAPDAPPTFVGYSSFVTNDSGAYQANLLTSNASIEHTLSAYLPQELLHRVRARLVSLLYATYSAHYQGYLGVDMMVCRRGDSYALHPCVEVNLRMNMGVVSRLLYQHFVHPEACGTYQVLHFSHPEQLQNRVTHHTAAHPLQIESGRIRRGFLPLVPITPYTQNLAYLLVE